MTPQERTDAERRVRQRWRTVRLVHVHRMARRLGHASLNLAMEDVDRIATKLGVSQRTIYRDLLVLKQLYQDIGSTTLD